MTKAQKRFFDFVIFGAVVYAIYVLSVTGWLHYLLHEWLRG
jgi:hypothetical protein